MLYHEFSAARGTHKNWSKGNISLCTSTPPVPSPAHFVLLPLSSQLLPACKGLRQHVNLLQRHILPTPILHMGNVKHSGDCCYFIIYEALVISYINNPWLQSVAGTVIEYSWGIFVENFHHHFKPRHKNKNFSCHFTVSSPEKLNLSPALRAFCAGWNQPVGSIWKASSCCIGNKWEHPSL